MSDEEKETTKSETTEKIDISAPRPEDQKNLNSSDDYNNVRRNDKKDR